MSAKVAVRNLRVTKPQAEFLDRLLESYVEATVAGPDNRRDIAHAKRIYANLMSIGWSK